MSEVGDGRPENEDGSRRRHGQQAQCRGAQLRARTSPSPERAYTQRMLVKPHPTGKCPQFGQASVRPAGLVR
ncbi:hypothetical protein [Imperialibacter sp.]|uniref:hypothetical protein n=1 Tax=Imperialibacter sp. TaxID=2038411 RepID=UPI0032EDDFA3